MTKAELIEAIAERTDLNRAEARAAVEAWIALVTETLARGEEVRLVGFGVFTPVLRPPGIARNPKTGAKVAKAATRTARFRLSESLKDALN